MNKLDLKIEVRSHYIFLKQKQIVIYNLKQSMGSDVCILSKNVFIN